MEKIFKYPIEVTDEQTIKLPKGADILCVQVQNGIPCLYAIVDPDTTTFEKRIIRTIGTGHPFSDGDVCLYIGTYQLHSGSLVFHVFQKINLLNN